MATVIAGLALVACEAGTDPSGAMEEVGSILATVTSGGSGVSDARLELLPSSGTSPTDTATTDATGEATFTEVESGEHEVALTVPSGFTLASGSADRVGVTVQGGEQATVSFELEPADTTTASADTVVVRATGYAGSYSYSGGTVTISPGTTVQWVNETTTLHTITPDGHDEWIEGSISNEGSTFSHTFETAGSFPYYCSPHRSQGMGGEITVQ